MSKYSTFVLITSILSFVFVVLFELAATRKVYGGGESFCINANADFGGDDAVVFSGIAALVLIIFVTSELVMFSTGLVFYFLINKNKCCKTMSTNLRVAFALAATVGINMILLVSLSGARVSGKLFLPLLTIGTILEQVILFVLFLSSHKAWTKAKHSAVTLTRSF